jgi:hypothetical protein
MITFDQTELNNAIALFKIDDYYISSRALSATFTG